MCESLCILLTLSGLPKIQTIPINNVCCVIIPPMKKSISKKSLKAPNYRDIHAHDECTQTSDHNCIYFSFFLPAHSSDTSSILTSC